MPNHFAKWLHQSTLTLFPVMYKRSCKSALSSSLICQTSLFLPIRCVKYYLIVVLLWVSLIVSDIEHVFNGNTYVLWKSARVLGPFFYCGVFAFLTDLEEFWYVLDVALARTSETFLNKSSSGRHSCLISDFKRNASNIFTFRINEFKSNVITFFLQLENLVQLHLP